MPSEDKNWILDKTKEVLDSSILTEGKYCRQLESELKQKLASKHVITTNSGTGALECMIRASRTKGEVIVPTETFSATIYAIIRAGCKPIFADSGADMSISPSSVKSLLNDNTSAVMLVHIGGFISDNVIEIKELCEKRGIPLFEDAAQAMGSTYDGRSPGRFGIAAGFSLFPTKVMASAEGGFIATDNDELAQLSNVLKDQGKTRGNYCAVQGYNWRMSELQAIIALTQLRRLDEFVRSRDKIAGYYDELTSQMSAYLEPHPRSKKCQPNWYKFISYLKSGNRDALKNSLKGFDINLSGEVYEVPCHVQEAFSEFAIPSRTFPVSEDLSGRHICFPLTSNMTMEQAKYFGEKLQAYFA